MRNADCGLKSRYSAFGKGKRVDGVRQKVRSKAEGMGYKVQGIRYSAFGIGCTVKDGKAHAHLRYFLFFRIPHSDFRILSSGHRMLDIGYWLLDDGCCMLDTRSRALIIEN